MLGTRKTTKSRELFRELPLNLFDTELFSSDSEPENSNMADSSASISDLTNPFAGTIDLKDKVGLSLFTKATEGLKIKFDLKLETSRKTVESIERANQAFFWGAVCFKIPSIKDGVDYDLITEYNKLTEDDVIAHARTIWGSGTTYEILAATSTLTEDIVQKRIRSSLISKWLINSMTEDAIDDIMLDKEKFQFKRASTGQIENDGPIMLKLVLTKINPSTRVGVSNSIAKLTRMNLADYKEDVVAMVNAFQTTYNKIKAKDKKGYSNVEYMPFLKHF